MIAVKRMGEFVCNNVVDQVWTGSHEINVERDIAAWRETAPPLCHPANDQMRQPQTSSFEGGNTALKRLGNSDLASNL
jgi:hypothetical protein